MEYRTLGRTGWRVAEIACGTYRTFDVAGTAGREAVARLMRTNLAAGANLFDSAPMYGHSEANIGHAMAGLAGVETPGGEPFFIATKVLQRDVEGARKQIENSFRAIGGRIDLLQIHNMAGWERVLPHLAELQAAGRIRATGVTHYQATSLGEMEKAIKTGLVDVIQLPYNLMERQAERRVLPLAREMGLGVLVMTPIQPIFRREALLSALAGVDLRDFRPYGVSDVGSLCLKYLLSKDPQVVLLPATSRPGRVAANAAVSGTPPLPADMIERLEAAL